MPSVADVTDPAALLAEVESAAPSAIVHLAAISSVTDSLADPGATWAVNTVGTVNLAEVVRRAAPGARLLVVSSGEVYGDTGDAPADESRPFAPRSPYAASKAAAELAAEQAARAHGLDVVSRGRSPTPAPATTGGSRCRRGPRRSPSWSVRAAAS